MAHQGELCETKLYKNDLYKVDLYQAELYRTEPCKTKLYEIKLCRIELCKTELCKTELGKTELFKIELCKTELCKTEFWKRVCVLQSSETQRGSHISGGFVCLRLKKQSVNHIFYEGLCASEQRITARITYFTRVCVPTSLKC